MINVLLVDDAPKDLKRLGSRLDRDNRLSVTAMAPPLLDDLEMLMNPMPDLFLLDYDLSLEQPAGGHSDYMGSTLAAVIREKAPEHPIISFTRQQNVYWMRDQRVLQTRNAFDGTIFKDDLEEDWRTTAGLIVSIAQGFEALRSDKQRNWASIMELLNAQDSEVSDLKATSPPAGEWSVAEAAQWTKDVVLKYPGILYDRVHAATALGLDVSAWENVAFRNLFSEVEYKGIFALGTELWWRGRLYETALQIILDSKVDGSINHVFREAAKSLLGLDLPPVLDINTGNIGADWVCYILKQPSLLETTLSYRPDSRPAVMDEARVSFKAIRESQLVREELFDPNALPLLSDIKQEPPTKQ